MEEHSSRPNLTIALLFIAGGVLLLMNNFNVTNIPWNDIIVYWPFILIFLGTENLLKGTTAAKILSFLIAMVIGAGLVWVVLQYSNL